MFDTLRESAWISTAILDQYSMTIGLLVFVLNFIGMLMMFKRKYKLFVGITVWIAATVLIAIYRRWAAAKLLYDWKGLPAFFYLVLFMWYVKGQTLHKVFAFCFQWITTIALWYLAEGITRIFIPNSNINFNRILFFEMMVIYGAYTLFMVKFSRRLMNRMIAYGNRTSWMIYSVGAVYSFVFLTTSRDFPGSLMQYIMLIIFVLWAFVVLCYAIISTHEKAAQAHQAETLSLQIHAMREQTDADKKHRNDIEILRHDMRHEMGIIMELFRTGKNAEAEEVFADWNTSLNEAAPKTLCAEPVLNAVFSRFEYKAKYKDIHLDVYSNIPDTLPLDTIKLSIIASNALENALTATEKVSAQNADTTTNRRKISVKLIQNDEHIGMEITNPCTENIEFDSKGLPITHKANHGIGVRSIAAFAEDNAYLLHFNLQDELFTMQLLMGIH
jgi:hypothetical protein